MIYDAVDALYDPRHAFPWYFTLDHWKILKTLSWWLKLAAIAMKESTKPFLKFDELSLIYISGWNFVINYMESDLDMALGELLIQLPWMIYLWVSFDGDLTQQEMFKSV